jgi:hypothetical protein
MRKESNASEGTVSTRRFPYERVGGDPASESEHFIRCSACGELIDMRDLDAVLVHEERCEEPTDLMYRKIPAFMT